MVFFKKTEKNTLSPHCQRTLYAYTLHYLPLWLPFVLPLTHTLCVCISEYLSECADICVHIFRHICIYVCVWKWTCVCEHEHVWMHMYIRIHACIFARNDTFIPWIIFLSSRIFTQVREFPSITTSLWNNPCIYNVHKDFFQLPNERWIPELDLNVLQLSYCLWFCYTTNSYFLPYPVAA